MRKLDNLQLKENDRQAIAQRCRQLTPEQAEQRFRRLCPALRTDAEEYELICLIAHSDRLALWRLQYLIGLGALLKEEADEVMTLSMRLNLPAPEWEHVEWTGERRPGRGDNGITDGARGADPVSVRNGATGVAIRKNANVSRAQAATTQRRGQPRLRG